MNNYNTLLYLYSTDPPTSFTLVLAQTENSCFTDLIWAPHITDRTITSYSVYRDSLHITTVPSTTTRYTDNQINVTMYSVVATSCAGSVTTGIMSAKLGKGLEHQTSYE